jgi:hypothetical protein
MMMAKVSFHCLLILLVGQQKEARAIDAVYKQEAPAVWLDTLELVDGGDGFPLAYGIELEYSFPSNMAALAYVNRLRAVKNFIDHAFVTQNVDGDSSDLKASVEKHDARFPVVLYDNYYKAHTITEEEKKH